MRRTLLDSPMRLAAMACAGSALGVAGFAGMGRRRGAGEWLLLCAGMVVVGMAGLYWASYELRGGVQSERWTEAEVGPLRRMVEHPAWNVVMFGALAALSLSLTTAKWRREFFWGFFLVLQMMTQIGGAFRRSVESAGSGARIEWTSAGKVQSDHWGER